MVVASAGASLPAEFAQAVMEFSLCDSELLLGSLAELSQAGPLGDEYYWLNSAAAPPRLQDTEDPAGQPSAPLEVVRLPGPEALCDIAGDWERLDALSQPRTPFSSPLWNSLWWKHYRRSDLLRKDEPLVLAVRSSDGQVVAVAPMFKRSWPAIGPARWRVIQFFGADASITELRGVVCAPKNRAMALDALKAYFHDEHRDWDLIWWDGAQPEQWQPRDAGTLVGAPRSLLNYYVTLPASWPELHSRLAGNFKRNMRKQRELFERDGHVYQLRVIEKPADVAKGLQTLFALHAQRAQFRGMDVKHRDRFANRATLEFVTEYALEMARLGKTQIFELQIGGDTVASQLTFSMDKDLWFGASGFDPDWRSYGIMTMLTVEIMQWAIESKYEVVNLSCGKDRGKMRWRPSEVAHTHFLESAPGIRGRLAMQAYDTIEQSRRIATRLRGYRPS